MSLALMFMLARTPSALGVWTLCCYSRSARLTCVRFLPPAKKRGFSGLRPFRLRALALWFPPANVRALPMRTGTPALPSNSGLLPAFRGKRGTRNARVNGLGHSREIYRSHPRPESRAREFPWRLGVCLILRAPTRVAQNAFPSTPLHAQDLGCLQPRPKNALFPGGGASQRHRALAPKMFPFETRAARSPARTGTPPANARLGFFPALWDKPQGGNAPKGALGPART